MNTCCNYCGSHVDIDHLVTFQLGNHEMNSCEGDCIIYLYQEYQQQHNFATWIKKS